MGTTLQHGIFLPAEGERNCYAGLASNWTILDGVVGGYSSHAANLTIHVTAADKEAWNGKADASALTAHTGNTTIHVTAEDKEAWNGKQNALSQTQLDAVNSGIDATKVQQIATNTSDISSLQSGKANDNSVVHTSGNETVAGTKSFSDVLRIYNSDSSSNTAQLWLQNSKVNRGQPVYGDQTIFFRDALDKMVTAVISRVTSTGASALLLQTYNVDQDNQQVSNYLSFVKNLDGSCYLLPDKNDAIVLGSSSAKFKNINTNLINGLTPSSLSLPSTTGVVDISSYITDLTGTANTYTVLANGYIQFDVTGSSIEIDVTNGLSQKWIMTDPKGFIPVVSGASVSIKVVGTAINNFKFIPCQGNA